jgi:uncharacterized membrane protein
MDNVLISIRRDKAEILGGAHAMAADICSHRYKTIAVPLVTLSAIVGVTTLGGFIDFGPEHHTAKLAFDIILSILAILVAILTSLQTLFDYSARSEQHAAAARHLFTLGRKWELLFDTFPELKDVKTLDEELDTIIDKAPRVSSKLQQLSLSKQQQNPKAVPPDAFGLVRFRQYVQASEAPRSSNDFSA